MAHDGATTAEGGGAGAPEGEPWEGRVAASNLALGSITATFERVRGA